MLTADLSSYLESKMIAIFVVSLLNQPYINDYCIKLYQQFKFIIKVIVLFYHWQEYLSLIAIAIQTLTIYRQQLFQLSLEIACGHFKSAVRLH